MPLLLAYFSREQRWRPMCLLLSRCFPQVAPRPLGLMTSSSKSGQAEQCGLPTKGAKGYEFNPTGFFTLHYLWLPGIGDVKKERADEGFSIGPSFRYVYKRDSDGHPELRGLGNIDAAFELGGRIAYQWSMFRPWLAVRYGLGGHSGIVAETGLDLRFRPSSVTEFTIGPRASFATNEYMRTYFGVTPVESARSGLSAYNLGGGIIRSRPGSFRSIRVHTTMGYRRLGHLREVDRRRRGFPSCQSRG